MEKKSHMVQARVGTKQECIPQQHVSKQADWVTKWVAEYVHR